MHAMRLVDEFDSALGKRAMHPLDVRDPQVEHRAGMILFGLLRRGEHQAHRAYLKKRERRWCLKQQWQAEGVAVELHGAIQIVDDVGHLCELHCPSREIS